MQASPKRNITLFLVLTFAFSSVWYYFILSAGSMNVHGGAFVMALMWSPGVAALLTRLITQHNLRGFGWRPGKPRYLAYAYVIPLLAAIPVYGFVWLTGLAGTDFSIIGSLGFGMVDASATWQALLVFMLVGPLLSLQAAIGEELGWRGLLVPELARRYGNDVGAFHKLALISGAIWSVYHYPVLLFADYNAGLGWWVSLPAFTLLVMTGSYIFAWLTLKSGSFWPAALLHATHNLFIQAFFDRATVNGEWSLYITSEFGFGIPVIYGLLAWLCVRDVKRNGFTRREHDGLAAVPTTS